LESEALLQGGARRSGFPVVVPGAGLRSVLADQVHRDVDVVVAFGGGTVADGDPAAWRLPVRAGEAEGIDHRVRRLGPLGVGELALVGPDGQRAVPDMPARHL